MVAMALSDIQTNKFSGSYPHCGAIFMCNKKTIDDCLTKKVFGLPISFMEFVTKIKAGMVLFLFQYEERRLHGVFRAVSDGAMNIKSNAFCSTARHFPAQVQYEVIWNCNPLIEDDFRDAIRENYYTKRKFNFGLCRSQVHKLLLLFNSRRSLVHKPLVGKEINKKRSVSLDNLKSMVDCVEPGLQNDDRIFERRSGKLARISLPNAGRVANVHASATSVGTDNLSLSGSEPITMLTTMEHLGDYIPLSTTENSDPGDYIPLSSPEPLALGDDIPFASNHLDLGHCKAFSSSGHSNFSKTKINFSEVGTLENIETEFETHIIPRLPGAFSSDKVQCDSNHQVDLQEQMNSFSSPEASSEVKEHGPNTPAEVSSGSSCLNLIEKVAAPEVEADCCSSKKISDEQSQLDLVLKDIVCQDEGRLKNESVDEIMEKLKHLQDDLREQPILRVVRISWTPPAASWVKLNADGSSKGYLGPGGAAAVLRNEYGDWICGTTRRLDIASVELAELWAIFDGLQMAWELGYRCVDLETDSLNVIQMLFYNSNIPPLLVNLMHDCWLLFQLGWIVRVHHCYKEANKCADRLARSAVNQKEPFVVLDSPPPTVKRLLDWDSCGMITNRAVYK